MLPFVALPPLPPVLGQVLQFPVKQLKPGLEGKAVVKFRVGQGSRTAQRLRFLAFYADRSGTAPAASYPNVSFLPPEMLVPPGGRTKTARVSFDLSSLSGRQKVFVCAKTIPKIVNKPSGASEAISGTATLSVLSCWPLVLMPN